MSLCHIWLGVDRSNRRSGFLAGFRAFFLGVANPVACNWRRTVFGLAFRKNSRRSICEIRFAPCPGFSRFNAVIFSTTAFGVLIRRCPFGFGFSPSSPPSRYCRTQSKIHAFATPISAATRYAGSPSSM